MESVEIILSAPRGACHRGNACPVHSLLYILLVQPGHGAAECGEVRRLERLVGATPLDDVQQFRLTEVLSQPLQRLCTALYSALMVGRVTDLALRCSSC